MKSIASFLKMSQEAAKIAQPLTVVLGNESGDLDSVIGSISLAYVLNTSFKFGTTVPVLNFDPQDLPLRSDVNKFLSLYGITKNMLLTAEKSCRDNESFVDIANEEIQIILFDHNRMSSCFTGCERKVVGVVDHHKNENLYLETTQSLRIIKPTGSASTHVVKLCLDHNIDFPFPSFLAAPIVIDCENFDFSRNRATEEDVYAFKWLERKAVPQLNPLDLYQKLKQWRADIFDLSVEENLRRDYKFSECKSFQIGVSSIPCSRVKFIEHYPSYIEPCLHFMDNRNIKGLFLTFAGTDGGKHQRDLMIIGKRSNIEGFLTVAASDPVFVKVDETLVDHYSILSYSITDTTISRKKLMPLIISTL